MPTLQERFRTLRRIDLAAALRVDEGGRPDYDRLAVHHYRAGCPATVTRVLALRDDRPTVVGRFTARASGRDPAPAAVLVESMPRLACRLRDRALGERYGSWLPPTERARLINAEVRCISRVVVDPRWRGAGLAVRLVRHALATATTPVTEALAAMGHVSPFFARAGMTAYRRPPHLYDARFMAALRLVGLDPADLVFPRRARTKLDALPEVRRAWLLGELDRWYRQSLGRDWRRLEADVTAQWRAAAQRLAAAPVYFVHVAPARVMGGLP